MAQDRDDRTGAPPGWLRALPVLGLFVVLALVVALSLGLRAEDDAADRALLGLGMPSAPPTQPPVDPAAPVAPQDSAPVWTSSVDLGWAQEMARRTGMPLAAVRAYAAATLALPKGCTLGWNTLAGVGWVESQHGTLDGRTLAQDGTSDPRVIGPALNGQNGYAAIRSTPAGAAQHGDATWDHAIGPMQFIDSTWQRWGRDGDGDGEADPFDIDDAAATAAAYLCADGRDLRTPAGWSGAILSYNRDPQYVQHVLDAANRYAAAANAP